MGELLKNSPKCAIFQSFTLNPSKSGKSPIFTTWKRALFPTHISEWTVCELCPGKNCTGKIVVLALNVIVGA